jgi:hypothetical protein
MTTKYAGVFGATDYAILYAPWTDEQVAALNAFQRALVIHPYTCSKTSTDLVATRGGWHCPCGCGHDQRWADPMMLDTRFHSRNDIVPPTS